MRWAGGLVLVLVPSVVGARPHPELSCAEGIPAFARMPALELVSLHESVIGLPDWAFAPFDSSVYGFDRVDVYLRGGPIVEETSLAPGGAVHELELTLHLLDGDEGSWLRLRAKNNERPDVLRLTAGGDDGPSARPVEEGVPLFYVEYPDFWSGRTPWRVTHKLLLDLRGEPAVLASLECSTVAGTLGACGSIDAPFGQRSTTSCGWSPSHHDYLCVEASSTTTLSGSRIHETRFLLTSGAILDPKGDYDDPIGLARAVSASSPVGSMPREVAGYGKLRLVRRWALDPEPGRPSSSISLFVGPIPRDELAPPFYAVRLGQDRATDSGRHDTRAAVPTHDPPFVWSTEVHADDDVRLFRVVAAERSRDYFTGEPTESRSLVYVGVEPETLLVDAHLVATTGFEYAGCGTALRARTAVLAREDWRSLRAFVEIEPEHPVGLDGQIGTTALGEPRCSETGEIRWVRGRGFVYHIVDPCIRRSRPRFVAIDERGWLRFYFARLSSP